MSKGNYMLTNTLNVKEELKAREKWLHISTLTWMFNKGVARRLFKSRHNMIKKRSRGVKALSKSKGARPCKQTEGGRVAEYATEPNIFNFGGNF